MTTSHPPVPAPAGTPPEVSGTWLRPVSESPAEPRWGFPDGIQVGLHPLGGPRGLLRVYAPYLGHPRDRLVNFIAIEPIPAGGEERGFSELEHSELDAAAGKRFWSSDALEDAAPRDPRHPTRGVVEVVDGVEHLTVFVHAERFANGAEVSVRLRFRADRPREFELAAFRRAGSVELRTCVLTATMGNFARLRRLHLADAVVTPAQLWPGFEGAHFTEHGRAPLARVRRAGEAALVYATPDEPDPHAAAYADDTASHWRYFGSRAVQGWRVDEPSEALEVLVNGRWAYWMSTSGIPGGVAYENFEVLEPFREGQRLTFWIEPFGDDGEIDEVAALHA